MEEKNCVNIITYTNELHKEIFLEFLKIDQEDLSYINSKVSEIKSDLYEYSLNSEDDDNTLNIILKDLEFIINIWSIILTDLIDIEINKENSSDEKYAYLTSLKIFVDSICNFKDINHFKNILLDTKMRFCMSMKFVLDAIFYAYYAKEESIDKNIAYSLYFNEVLFSDTEYYLYSYKVKTIFDNVETPSNINSSGLTTITEFMKSFMNKDKNKESDISEENIQIIYDWLRQQGIVVPNLETLKAFMISNKIKVSEPNKDGWLEIKVGD